VQKGEGNVGRDILANEGPPHQAFTTLSAKVQFHKIQRVFLRIPRVLSLNLIVAWHCCQRKARLCPTIATQSIPKTALLKTSC